jgi:hypothetical protein
MLRGKAIKGSVLEIIRSCENKLKYVISLKVITLIPFNDIAYFNLIST